MKELKAWKGLNLVAPAVAATAALLLLGYMGVRHLETTRSEKALTDGTAALHEGRCLCLVPYEVSIGESAKVDASCGEKGVKLALRAIQGGALPFTTFRQEGKSDYVLMYGDLIPIAFSTSHRSAAFDYSTTALTCREF